MIKSFLRKIYPQDEFLALGIFLTCFAIIVLKKNIKSVE